MRLLPLAVAAFSFGSLASIAPAIGQPARSVVAMETVRPDPRTLADQIADVARRCWLPKEAAFAGPRFDRIEPGAEPNIYRIVFADRPKGGTPPRSIRVLAGWLGGSSTVVVLEQDGVDVKETVGRDAKDILKGRSVSC
jgi:hypothetical protein